MSDASKGPQLVLPKQARVVVIGGGVIGTSTAYHFAQIGRAHV